MKARNNKTRWLLIALLFGFLAAVGLTLVHHHGYRNVAEAIQAPVPAPAALQQPGAPIVAAAGEKQTLRVPAAIGAADDSADIADSNSQQPPTGGHSAATANTSTGNAGVDSDGASGETPPPSNHSATPAAAQPQSLANGYAYNGAALLDCELPAGCGANGGTAVTVIRQSSGTSGGVTQVHDSTPTDNDSNPQTNDGGNPPPGNNDQPPGDPPGHTVSSAPELDPATLAGAVTLLLGALAVLRSRRVRVTR